MDYLDLLNERHLTNLILQDKVADEVLVDAGPDYWAKCTYTQKDLCSLMREGWELEGAIKIWLKHTFTLQGENV